MKKIKTLNGWYDENVFEVEPQVAWLTTSEVGINVWLKKVAKQRFETSYNVHKYREKNCKWNNWQEQIIDEGQGVFTFGPLTIVLDIRNPPPNDRWVTIRVKQEKSVLKLSYKIPVFWPATLPTYNYPAPNFRLVIASCFRMPGDTGSEPIFPTTLYKLFRNKIVETSIGPNAQNSGVLLMGDTVYLNGYNYDTKSGIIARYRQLQKLPELKDAWSVGTTWNAVMDDHEMSINDGTFGAPSINLCLDIFTKIWPAYPFIAQRVSPQTFAFTRYDVGFIGLDDRTYRTNAEAPYPTILGEVQFEWLRQVLYSITEIGGRSVLIFIMTGTPFLPPGSSSFNEYPAERQRILNLINNELQLTNIFFLSGDTHFSDVSVYGNITEIRNSAMSSKPRDPNRYPNPYRVPGSAVMPNNFGVLDISGGFLNRQISYSDYISDGTIAYSTIFQQKPPI